MVKRVLDSYHMGLFLCALLIGHAFFLEYRVKAHDEVLDESRIDLAQMKDLAKRVAILDEQTSQVPNSDILDLTEATIEKWLQQSNLAKSISLMNRDVSGEMTIRTSSVLFRNVGSFLETVEANGYGDSMRFQIEASREAGFVTLEVAWQLEPRDD